jgi:hypothetical protein
MNKQDIPARIEELRREYKSLMNRTDMSTDIAPQHHEFAWEGNYLTVDLNFIDMDSPTGFPYRRLTCLMKVNGKKVSKKKLDELFNQQEA